MILTVPSIQVEVLLECGAIPDKEDRGGDTAESWAREWGDKTYNYPNIYIQKAWVDPTYVQTFMHT